MVKKNAKCGLNTGNTVRGSRRQAAIRDYQKYGCLVLGCDEPCANNFTAKEILDDVHSYLPSHSYTVEYSLNKKCRWALPAQMKQKVKEVHDSRDLEVIHKFLVDDAKLLVGWRTRFLKHWNLKS